MSLTSPLTLLLAWVVAPGVVALASAALGLGLSRIAGVSLGALTLPAGFGAGMALMGMAFDVGLNGRVAVVIAAVVAIACAVAWEHGRRRAGAPLPVRTWIWAAVCGLLAFGIAMAPLVGYGRAGIVGYVLNNDPSVHLSTIELLRDNGPHGVPNDSSYATISSQFGGYPLGSYAWPLLASTAIGADPFFVWTPVIAVALAMTALVGYAVARRMGGAPWLAAGAGVLVGCGYLPYSYLAQGGAKEVMFASGFVTAVALFGTALDAGVSVRRLVPAAFVTAGALACIGIGALSVLGPAALLGAGVALWRSARRRRLRAGAGALAGATAVALLLVAPGLADSIRFQEGAELETRDVNALGNLVGEVPWREAFNVWLGGDYRFPDPDHVLLTNAGIALAALLAVVGVVAAIRRSAYAVPFAVAGGAVGSIYVAHRYAAYFEVKIYAVLAVALALATAAGVVALASSPRWRIPGLVAGALVLTLVLASDAIVYRQAWATPEARFQELIDLGERYEGQGPVLIVERDEYARHFLRNAKPWDSWGPWQPTNGLRVGFPPPPPHSPDFDDYQYEFINDFPLLLERRKPGASAPPTGFELAEETPHYRMWRRTGSLPKDHFSLGISAPDGTERLDCTVPEVQQFLDSARGSRLRIATRTRPLYVVPPKRWFNYAAVALGSTPDSLMLSSGFSLVRADLPEGRYVSWIQGQFGPGVRHYSGLGAIGEARGDLGQQDQWHRLGEIGVPPEGAPQVLLGLERKFWQAGVRRRDQAGPMAFEPLDATTAISTLPGTRGRSLCGRRLDWMETF